MSTYSRNTVNWRRGAGAVVLAAVHLGRFPVTHAAGQSADAGAPSLLAPPPPRVPPARPNEGTYFLEPTRGGGYMYDDLRFVARIAPDGAVTFSDKHLQVETRIFGIPLRDYRKPDGRRLSLFEALEKAFKPDPTLPSPLDSSFCAQAADPRLPLSASCRVQPVTIVGTFDFTDEVMKLTGQGWYKYEKAKFLSATFEFRVRMAAERHAKLLREAIAELPARLDAIWSNPGFTPREKRRIVCLLWAEVNVDDGPSRRAADVIIGWIKTRAPLTSASVYSDSELAACAAEGRRPFTPYDY